VGVSLTLNKVRFSSHALARMAERKIIYYEIQQALWVGKHDAKRDRYALKFQSWEYSVEGYTKDRRHLRIGVSFETLSKNGERLIIVTAINLGE
jgi:hypothetical protein